MQLNIKNEEAYRLATRLAEMKNETLTEAVTRALRERLERERSERRRAIRRIVEEFQAQPDRDPRPWREIEDEMYDDFGLPK